VGVEAGVLAPWLARISRFAELARDGTSVVVACSGGPDSLALLALTAAADIAVEAVHVDHGLRDGTASDFAVVADAAGALGVRARSVRIDVGSGGNLEARARDARYAALDAARVEAGAALVLVGHTADDQAETVLLNLLRGAATAGLAAMREVHGTIVRPLLGLRRADTTEICARLRFVPVVDPMNSDGRFRRVWLRREVIPTLEAGAGRDLPALLARQAEVLRDETDLLESLATLALADAGDPPRIAVLAALDPALARRAVRQWLGGRPASLATVDAVLAVVRGERRAVEVPGGARVVRRGGRLERVGDADAAPADGGPERFGVPGATAALGIDLECWIERAAPVAWPDGIDTCVVDADAVGEHAWLRVPVRGERFAPLGLQGTTAVARVAPGGTARVVATDPTGGVVWVVGYRIDDRVRVTARTRRFLWMTVSQRVRT
jgi:tRNA(Ile)-lysidine synthase